MTGMPKVQSIRRRRMNGESVASIARSENAGEPTVRKYLKAGDLSPRPPVRRRRAESVVDRYVPAMRAVARGGSSYVAQAAAYGHTHMGASARRVWGGGVVVDGDAEGRVAPARVRRGARGRFP